MTDKDAVLRVWPDAETFGRLAAGAVWADNYTADEMRDLPLTYRVRADKYARPITNSQVLGEGTTPDEAWVDARRKMELA